MNAHTDHDDLDPIREDIALKTTSDGKFDDKFEDKFGEKFADKFAEPYDDQAEDLDEEDGVVDKFALDPAEGALGAWADAGQVQIDTTKKRSINLDDENEEDDVDLDQIEDILALPDNQYPRFTLAKNKARFLRMVSWYKNKQEWLEVAPLSGVSKLFKQQTKELVGIRASKLDYEMELETGTLTPSQRSYRRDELKMCKVHEKMAVNLIARMQVKIKSGRR